MQWLGWCAVILAVIFRNLETSLFFSGIAGDEWCRKGGDSKHGSGTTKMSDSLQKQSVQRLDLTLERSPTRIITVNDKLLLNWMSPKVQSSIFEVLPINRLLQAADRGHSHHVASTEMRNERIFCYQTKLPLCAILNFLMSSRLLFLYDFKLQWSSKAINIEIHLTCGKLVFETQNKGWSETSVRAPMLVHPRKMWTF